MDYSQEQRFNSEKKHKEHKRDKKHKKSKERKKDKAKRHRHNPAVSDAPVAMQATAAVPQPAESAVLLPSAAPQAAPALPSDSAVPAAAGVAQMTPFETQEYVKRVLFGHSVSQQPLQSVELLEEFTEEYAPLTLQAGAASDGDDDSDGADDGDHNDADADIDVDAHDAADDAGGGVQTAGDEGADRVGLDFGPARAKQEEIWVLKLPPGVELASLAGRVLHLPCDPPEARHLRPPKDLLSGRYDLLAYVKAAVKPTAIGHLELNPQEAAAHGVHVYRELHQEGEYVAANLRCAAHVGEEPQEKMKALRVARVINISDDVLTLNQQALAAALTEGVPLWGDEDGWDGKLAPRKRRKRVAGWHVVGLRRHKQQQRVVYEAEVDEEGVGYQADDDDGGGGGGGVDGGGYEDPFAADVSSSGSDGDEEFDEVVFLPDKEVPILKEDQERQQQLEEQQKAEGYGPEQVQEELLQQLQADQETDPVDWDERNYREGWDPLQQQQLEQDVPGPLTQPEPQEQEQPELDLYHFLLSLPVRADVLAEQQAYVAHFQQHEAADHQQDEDQQQQQDDQNALSPNSRQQQQLYYEELDANYSPLTASEAGTSPADDDDAAAAAAAAATTAADGDDAGDAAADGNRDQIKNNDYINDGDDVDIGDGEGGNDDGHGDGDGDRDGDAAGIAADEGQEDDKQQDEEWLPPPRPIPVLLDAVTQFEPVLMSVSADYNMFIKLRNKLIKLTLDYEDFCAQIDMDAMPDDSVTALLVVLEEAQRRRDAAAGLIDDDDMLRDLEELEDEDEEHQVQQVARLLLPWDGPSPRPQYKQVDQGYAPYQVDDEGREYVVIPPPSPDWAVTDGHLAERVVQAGAGRLHRFVSTHELRSKGFEWDTDPEDERREGLVISLPDGRSMHIPRGLHFDFDS